MSLRLPLEIKRKNGCGVQVVLVLDLARPSDLNDIFELFLAQFFTRTPIKQEFLFDEKDESTRPTWWLEEIRKDCSHSLICSVVVREKGTGRLVSVMSNRIIDRHGKIFTTTSIVFIVIIIVIAI